MIKKEKFQHLQADKQFCDLNFPWTTFKSLTMQFREFNAFHWNHKIATQLSVSKLQIFTIQTTNSQLPLASGEVEVSFAN